MCEKENKRKLTFNDYYCHMQSLVQKVVSRCFCHIYVYVTQTDLPEH